MRASQALAFGGALSTGIDARKRAAATQTRDAHARAARGRALNRSITGAQHRTVRKGAGPGEQQRREHGLGWRKTETARRCVRDSATQHTTARGSIRPHVAAHDSTWQHTTA
eukprot:6174953-Pleurochrysis_carterae.AAC.4